MNKQNLNLDEAAKHSHRNKTEVLKSNECGCYYCLRVFSSKEIDGWTGGGKTAICPYCMIDSVIGDASGYAITRDLLEKLNKRLL